MHELGITRSLVDIAERHAREQRAKKVLSVTVTVGDLAGVVPEALEFCFEACTRETLLEGAALLIERIPGRGRCRGCGAETPLEPLTPACPACRSLDMERLQGDELQITEMEVE